MERDHGNHPGTHHVKRMVARLLPGIVLPGLIYLVASRRAPLLVALAAASSVPLLDVTVRLLRGLPPTTASLLFLAGAAVSVTLAFAFRSPAFILAKGAAVSGVLGMSFALSALLGRPLTRTLAVRLSTEQREARRRLAALWENPRTHRVFCTLSLGWGILLLLSAAQQALVVVTLSPGAVMWLEPPVRTAITGLGVLGSIAYVRRVQQLHPEVQLLPTRGPSRP